MLYTRVSGAGSLGCLSQAFKWTSIKNPVEVSPGISMAFSCRLAPVGSATLRPLTPHNGKHHVIAQVHPSSVFKVFPESWPHR